MNRAKWMAVMILAMIGMSSSSAEAQVTDSLVIEVLGAPNALQLEGPQRVVVGDSIDINWTILDDLGTPTEGVVTWQVRPTEAATIIQQTDNSIRLVINSRVLDAEGNPLPLRLIATVERLDRLVIGGRYLQPGGVDPQTGMEVAEGTFAWATDGQGFYLRANTEDALQLCVVGLAGERVLFASSADCFNNLDTLVGAVPPVTDLFAPWWRRADLTPVRSATGPLPAARLRPEMQRLLG